MLQRTKTLSTIGGGNGKGKLRAFLPTLDLL